MGYMQHQECLDMFRNVLLNGHVHTLYRDDTIITHDFLLKHFETIKGFLFFLLNVRFRVFDFLISYLFRNATTKKLIEIIKETQPLSFQNA